MPRNEEFLAGLNYVPSNGVYNATVRAFTPDMDPETDRPAGLLRWSKTSRGEITMVSVGEGYQRQGLATELLSRGRAFAESTRGVPRPKHSTDRTNAGEAWARSLGERLPRREQRWDGRDE